MSSWKRRRVPANAPITNPPVSLPVPTPPPAAYQAYQPAPPYPAVAYPPVSLPVPPLPVQVNPLSSTGTSGGRIDGMQLAEAAADLTAMGFEKHAVSAYLKTIQSIAIQTSLANITEIATKVQALNRARLNRVAQAIRALPDLSLSVRQPGFLDRLAGPVVGGPALISRDEVLRILAVASEELPPL